MGGAFGGEGSHEERKSGPQANALESPPTPVAMLLIMSSFYSLLFRPLSVVSVPMQQLPSGRRKQNILFLCGTYRWKRPVQ